MASHSDTAERGKTTPSPGLASKGRLQDDRDPDDYRITWRYPPEFWDRLSKIPLVEDALEELDRRNRSSTRPSFPPRPTHPTRALWPQPVRAEIARFARHGGPDLADLRGYPKPNNKAISPQSTSSAPAPTMSERTMTPYHAGCEQHLIDNGIRPLWDSQAPNLGDFKSALRASRASLSPFSFSEGAFLGFKKADAQAKDEEDVKVRVMPTIVGTTDQPPSMNTLFGNLVPLTDGSMAPAKPDIYYGARPQDLDRAIRDELSRDIVPSVMEDRPLAPNFFMEVKGPNGSPAVMQRQARYDGAIGARGIHSLQNYRIDEHVYDGRPYAFSWTYQAGVLRLYTHHMTGPTTPGGRPDYHMADAGVFGIASDRKTFVEGVTAFRNARDMAEQYRDRFIRAANERARGEPGEEHPAAAGGATAMQGGGAPSPHQLVGDCEESPPTPDARRGVPGPHPQRSFVGGVDTHAPRQDNPNGPRRRANAPAASSHGSRPEKRSRDSPILPAEDYTEEEVRKRKRARRG